MGQRNYLIDGVSCSGKTSVATELQRRGYHVIHGDGELAYVGDPENGSPVDEPVAHADDRSRVEWSTEHWSWQLDKLKAIVSSVEQRPDEEWGAGGSRPEREEAIRLHQTREAIPEGRVIDATVPVARVVDEILRECEGKDG